MLGIAPIVYPSIRRGGPGGADLMVIDQSRAMSATLPSKWTGDEFSAVVMRTDCPSAEALLALDPLTSPFVVGATTHRPDLLVRTAHIASDFGSVAVLALHAGGRPRSTTRFVTSANSAARPSANAGAAATTVGTPRRHLSSFLASKQMGHTRRP
jgi:hypothetical protein